MQPLRGRKCDRTRSKPVARNIPALIPPTTYSNTDGCDLFLSSRPIQRGNSARRPHLGGARPDPGPPRLTDPQRGSKNVGFKKRSASFISFLSTIARHMMNTDDSISREKGWSAFLVPTTE